MRNEHKNQGSFIILAVQREASPLYHRAKILLDRLERLSADSTWAHRASGLRGSLLKAFDKESFLDNKVELDRFQQLIEQGYEILSRAASEIPDRDEDNDSLS